MKSLCTDESADSMLVFLIASSVLVFGIMFTILTYSFNAPIEAMNDLVSNGMLSLDTTENFTTMLNMWKASPFFMLIGLILFCYERSKGTTSLSSGIFFEYMFLMMISLIISAYLVYGYGMALDSMTLQFEQIPFFTDISPVWDTTAERSLMVSVLYYSCMLPGFLGAILYMLHPILRQTENSFLPDNVDNDDSTDEAVSYYQMQQF
jgi:hypothetical protein